MPSLRLGLFGGTFDPPHIGHLIVAQEVVEQLGLDRLLFVVAGLPPHKVDDVLSAATVRVEMARSAVEGNDSLGVSEVELAREGPTYTVDTLRHYRGEYPDAELFFIMGADQLAEFHDWQEPEAIMELATLVAMDREGVDPDSLSPMDLGGGVALDFRRIPVTRMDISSSEVRRRVRDRRSVEYMVPGEVRKIIERNRLYRPIS